MSIESFIKAVPKVELGVQLEGVMQRETLLMLADQNEIRDQVKRFDRWVESYQNPDFKKLEELTAVLRGWLQYGDDLVRAVYDVGVALSKDNVRYAEISINPVSFVTGDFTFEEFLNAINDGRNRAERAWGIQMRWIMVIPRSDARYADEIARWASSATGRNGGVVALELVGYDKKTSLDQYERAFQTAAKKNISRIAHLGEKDDVDEAVDLLALTTVVDGWGVAESPETLESLREKDVNLSIGLARAKAYGWIKEYSDYPVQKLFESGVPLTINSGMPTIFDTSLGKEYEYLLKHDMLNVDQLQTVILNSVRYSHLPEEERSKLLASMEGEIEALRVEHLPAKDEEIAE